MILSVGLALGILFEGVIAGAVVLAFLSNWQGIPGLLITLLFGAVVFKTCFSVARVQPGLWVLWGVLPAVFPVLIVLDRLFGAAIGSYAAVGSLAVSAGGLLGSVMGKRRASSGA